MGALLMPRDVFALATLSGYFLRGADDECWLWAGPLRAKGYGTVHWRGQSVHAHRVAYIAFIGPIEDGQDVHHRCHIRACVNPSHLEVIAHAVHGRLHTGASDSHCKNGHPVTAVNTREQVRKNGTVYRACRVCDRDRQREKYHAARSVS